MEAETVDLANADSAKFRELLDDMAYRFFRTCRAQKPDKPLSYFLPLWPAEQIARFETRFQKEQV